MGEALAERPTWFVRAAPGVLSGTDLRQRLFATQPTAMKIDAALHLDVAVRSIRSAAAAHGWMPCWWVTRDARPQWLTPLAAFRSC